MDPPHQLGLLDLSDDVLRLLLSHRFLTNREKACAARACRRLAAMVEFRRVVVRGSNRIREALAGGMCETLECGDGGILDIFEALESARVERLTHLRLRHLHWKYRVSPALVGLRVIEVTDPVAVDPAATYDPRVWLTNVCLLEEAGGAAACEYLRLHAAQRPPKVLDVGLHERKGIAAVAALAASGFRVEAVRCHPRRPPKHADLPALADAVVALATNEITVCMPCGCTADALGGELVCAVARRFRTPALTLDLVAGALVALDANARDACAPMVLKLKGKNCEIKEADIAAFARLLTRGAIAELAIEYVTCDYLPMERIFARAPALTSLSIKWIQLVAAVALFVHCDQDFPGLRHLTLHVVHADKEDVDVEELLGELGHEVSRLRSLRSVTMVNAFGVNIGVGGGFPRFRRALLTNPPPHLDLASINLPLFNPGS